MIARRGWVLWVLVLFIVLAVPSRAAPGPVPQRRIAFLIDSWYPRSHADVIGTRMLGGYRVGEKFYPSPLTVGSVYTDAPRPTDQTRTLAARHGFRVAVSVADALLEDPQAPRLRLAADGVLIATREDLPASGRPQSPTRRLHVVREVLRIMEQSGSRVPIFIDKMLASDWTDSQAIVTEAARRGVPLMAGSVLPFVPLNQRLPAAKVEVGVVVASTPYWAFAFHAAELLQGFMEQRSPRETGVTEIRAVGPAYWTMPNRDRWGGAVVDALLASAKTRLARAPAVPGGLGPDTQVLLIQYADGARAVLALVPRLFNDSEFLLGAHYSDGRTGTSGLILQGEPFDHFGYLVHALAELFTTGVAPVPVERTLLTTGIVLFGQQARQTDGAVSSPTLAISYPAPRTRP
jgi:hypothetical protein